MEDEKISVLMDEYLKGQQDIKEYLQSTFGKNLLAEVKRIYSDDNNYKTYNKKIEAIAQVVLVMAQQMRVDTKATQAELRKIGAAAKGYSSATGRKFDEEEITSIFSRKINEIVARGDIDLLDFTNKKARSNSTAMTVKKEFSSDFIKSLHGEFDSATDKLINCLSGWLGTDNENRKKKSFIRDFVDALGENKAIGGILTDTLKLISFLGASYLAKFGTLGRVIGAGLIIMLPSLASILNNAILSGVKSLLGGLSNFFLRSFLPSLLTPLGLGLSVIAAGGVGAVSMFKSSTKSFEEGDKLGGIFKLLSSAGFLTMAAGGVAAIISAPIAGPLIAIGASVGIIAGLIGAFHKQIGNFFRDVLVALGILTAQDKDENGNNIPGEDPDYAPYGGGTNVGWLDSITGKYNGESSHKGTHRKAKATQGEWDIANATGLVKNEDGSVKNFGKMTVEQAWKEMQRYKSEDPTNFNRLYETVGKNDEYGKYINFSSFQTDLSNRGETENGAASEVILGKGTVERFLMMKQYLSDLGYDTSDMKITSGIGTFGHYGTSTLSPHNLTGKLGSHNNPYGTTMDIGGAVKKGGKVISWKDVSDELKGVLPGQPVFNATRGYKIAAEKDHLHLGSKVVKSSKSQMDEAKKKVYFGDYSQSGASSSLEGESIAPESIPEDEVQFEEVTPETESYGTDNANAASVKTQGESETPFKTPPLPKISDASGADFPGNNQFNSRTLRDGNILQNIGFAID